MCQLRYYSATDGGVVAKKKLPNHCRSWAGVACCSIWAPNLYVNQTLNCLKNDTKNKEFSKKEGQRQKRFFLPKGKRLKLSNQLAMGIKMEETRRTTFFPYAKEEESWVWSSTCCICLKVTVKTYVIIFPTQGKIACSFYDLFFANNVTFHIHIWNCQKIISTCIDNGATSPATNECPLWA